MAVHQSTKVGNIAKKAVRERNSGAERHFLKTFDHQTQKGMVAVDGEEQEGGQQYHHFRQDGVLGLGLGIKKSGHTKTHLGSHEIAGHFDTGKEKTKNQPAPQANEDFPYHQKNPGSPSGRKRR